MCPRFWLPLWLQQIEQQKSYITVFWNGDSYYQAGILLVQSAQKKHYKHESKMWNVFQVNSKDTRTTSMTLI